MYCLVCGYDVTVTEKGFLAHKIERSITIWYSSPAFHRVHWGNVGAKDDLFGEPTEYIERC